MDDLIRILGYPFLACLVLMSIHCYLGLHIVTRGVIFVDLSLAQMAALGSSLALLLGYEIGDTQAYLGGLIFTFVGATLFALSRMRKEKIPQEAIIGIVYAVASAATILILSQSPHGTEHIKAMLDGGLLYVDGYGVLKILIVYIVIGIFHYLFRRQFMLISTNPAEALARGMKIRLWDFLFYITFGFVVTTAVQIVGVLLVFSYLIIPAVCAMFFTDRIIPRLIIGWGIGILASALGLLISYYGSSDGLPSGSSIVVSFGAVFIVAVLLRLLIKRRVITDTD
jgi:zinc/manganese transport system permease protein